MVDFTLILYSHAEAMFNWLDKNDPGKVRQRTSKMAVEELLLQCMTTVHSAATMTDMDDAALRGTIALRLGRLLLDSGEHRSAVEALREGVAGLQAARDQLVNHSLHLPRRSDDQQALTAAAVSCYFDNPLEEKLSQRPGVGAYGGTGLFGAGSQARLQDNSLACLHADLISTLFEAELALSAMLQGRIALSRPPRSGNPAHGGHGSATATRGDALDGPSSRNPSRRSSLGDAKGVRVVEAMDDDGDAAAPLLERTKVRLGYIPGGVGAPYLPSKSTEARLMAECGSNYAWQVLLLLQLARYRPPATRARQELLQDAAKAMTLATDQITALQQVQHSQAEAAAEASYSTALGCRADVGTVNPNRVTDNRCAAPRLLARGASFIAVAPSALPYAFTEPVGTRRQRSRIAKYRMYAKPKGSGTDVALTCTDLVNTGEDLIAHRRNPNVPASEEADADVEVHRLFASVQGLTPNMVYVFACAAFDAEGNMLGDSIGATSSPVLAASPLPLMQLWAYLALEARRESMLVLARMCASMVARRWVAVGPMRPTHMRLPSQTLVLRQAEVDRAPVQLISLLVRCLFILAETGEGGAAQDRGRGRLPGEVIPLPKMDADEEDEAEDAGAEESDEASTQQPAVSGVLRLMDDKGDNESSNTLPLAKLLGDSGHGTTWVWEGPWSSSEEAELRQYSEVVRAQLAAIRRVQSMALATQAASAIRDPTLVMQAAAGTYTMARPLLVWKRKPASLLHALVQVHMALQLLPPHAWNPATAATFARVAYELNTAAQQCDEALMLDTAFKQLGVGSGPEPAIPAAGARSAYAPHAVVEYKSADGASSSQQDEEADAGNAARAKDAAAESSQDQSQSSSKYRSRWVPAAGGGWYNPWVVDAKDPPHVRTNKLEVYGTAFGMLTAEIDALQGSEQEAFVEFMLASPAWAEANLASLVDSGSENTTEATPSDPNDVFDSSPHGILRSLAGLADDWKRDELIAEEQKRLQAAEDHIREEKEAHEAAVAAAGADGADQVPPAVDETIPDAPPDHGGEGTLSFLKTRQHRRTHARALTEVWAATLKSPTAAVEMLRTKYADSEWLPELLCRVCAATLHLNRTGSVEEAIEAQKASAAAAAEAEERARQGEPVTPEGEETNSTVAHVALTIARWIRSFIPLIVRTATPGDEAAPADGSHDNTANEATVVSLGRLPTYVRRVLLAEQYQGVEGDEEEGVGSAMTRVYSTDVLPADVGIGRRPGTPRAGAGGGGFSRPDSPSGNSAVEPDSMGGGDEESPTWHVFTTADTGAVSVDDRRALLWLAELAFVESVAWQARLLSVATVTAESHPIYSGAGPAHSIELELELLPAADLGAVPPAEAARNAVQRVLDTALKQPAAGAGDEAGDGTGSPTEPTSPSTPSEPKSQSVAGLQLSAMPNARDTIALAQATMDASARAAVRARGALAWVAMRNSLRILWNTLRSAWIAPHAFGAYAAEVAGRGTEPDPQASAAAAAANEEGASPAEAAAESAPEESSGPESAEPAAAQFHWAPLWRASLCILDLFEAVGRDKVERLWARGLEPGYGQGRGGLRQTADPNAAEDADSEDGDVDDASEGDVAEAGMDFGTCLPRGMTSDDFVWMIQLLLYTGQALCYAQQWRTVLSLADRLHQLFPHSFISLDTGLPGQSVKKDPISGAVLVQSDDPDADAGGIKFAADARTLAGAAADSASILYALRRAFGAAALDAGSGLFKEGEDPTEARVREGLGGGLAGMFADDQIWGSAAVGAVGAVGGGDDQIDNDRTGWHNLHALSQLLRVQLYDSSLLNVAAPVGGLIADDAAASLLPLAVHAAEQLWQVTARHRRWCEAAITTFDEEYKALTSGPVKKRRKKATLVAQEAKLSAQQAAYLAGKQMLDAVLSEHAHREERAKSKMMMMKQRLEDRQRDLAVGRTALADSRALLGRHLASRVFQDQHLQSLANETRDSEGFAQRLVSAPALATAKKQGAAPPAPPGATAGGEMTVYRKAIDHFDTPVARVEGSYRRTIQLLRKRQERPLLCQALQDLAKFYASQGSSHMPQALRTWQDAVDASFSTLDAVQNWQAVLTNLSPDPLAALGVHGILLPAVALCRIARHGLVGKEDVRTLHHRFAAALFKAMFDASAQHPRRAIDFGRYQALELVPGVDELADARVVTAEDLLFATRECIAGLLSHGSTFVEEALPAIALYEYLARYRLASVQRTVDARLLRARALTIPGDLTGAARVIEALVRGLDMPHTGVARSSSATPLPPPATTEAGEDAAAHKDDAASGDKLDLTRASELPEVWWTEGVPMPRYYNHLPSSHPLNRACLYWVADPAVGLPVPLGLLLGDLLCARLGLVRAEFLHAASGGLHANVPTMPRGVWGDWEHRHMFNAAKDVKPAAPPAEPEDAAAAKGNGKGKDAAPEAPVVSEPLQPSGPLEFDGSLDGVVELSAEAKTWGGGTGWSLRSACIAAADAFCKDVYNRFDPDAKVVAPPSASTSQRSSAHGKAKGSARASARSRSPRDGRVLAKGKGKSKGKGKGVEFDQNSARSAAFVSPRTSTRAQLFVEELELLVAAQWRLGEGKTILGQHRRALADWAEAKRFFARLSGARAWRKLGKPRGQQPAGEGGADAADAATSAGVNVMGESQVVLEGSRRLGQPLSAVDWLRLRERIARALMLVRCTPAAVGVLERGLREAHGLEASLVGHRLLLARAEAAVALGDDATAGAAIGIVCSKGQQRAMAQARPSGGDPDSAVTAAALLAKVLLERQNAGAQLDAAREQLVQERREEVARLKRRGILVPDDATESESKDDGSKGGATASSVLRRVTAQDVADMERAFADMLTRHTELLRTAEALLRRRAVAIGCRMWYIDGDVVKDSDPDAADKLNDLTGQAAAAVAGTVGGDNSVGRTRSAPIRTFASFVPGGEEFTPITPCPPTAALDSLYLPYLDSLAATRYQLGRVLLEVGGIAMDRAVAQCRVDEAELRRQHAEALAKDRMVATLVLESDDDDASPTDETAGSGTGDGDKATEATAEGEAVEAAIHTQYQQQLHNRESMALLGAALRTLEKARGVLRHVHKPSVRLLAQTLWGVGRARRQLLSALRPTGQLQLLGIAADFTEQERVHRGIMYLPPAADDQAQQTVRLLPYHAFNVATVPLALSVELSRAGGAHDYGLMGKALLDLALAHGALAVEGFEKAHAVAARGYTRLGGAVAQLSRAAVGFAAQELQQESLSADAAAVCTAAIVDEVAATAVYDLNVARTAHAVGRGDDAVQQEPFGPMTGPEVDKALSTRSLLAYMQSNKYNAESVLSGVRVEAALCVSEAAFADAARAHESLVQTVPAYAAKLSVAVSDNPELAVSAGTLAHTDNATGSSPHLQIWIPTSVFNPVSVPQQPAPALLGSVGQPPLAWLDSTVPAPGADLLSPALTDSNKVLHQRAADALTAESPLPLGYSALLWRVCNGDDSLDVARNSTAASTVAEPQLGTAVRAVNAAATDVVLGNPVGMLPKDRLLFTCALGPVAARDEEAEGRPDRLADGSVLSQAAWASFVVSTNSVVLVQRLFAAAAHQLKAALRSSGIAQEVEGRGRKWNTGTYSFRHNTIYAVGQSRMGRGGARNSRPHSRLTQDCAAWTQSHRDVSDLLVFVVCDEQNMCRSIWPRYGQKRLDPSRRQLLKLEPSCNPLLQMKVMTSRQPDERRSASWWQQQSKRRRTEEGGREARPPRRNLQPRRAARERRRPWRKRLLLLYMGRTIASQW